MFYRFLLLIVTSILISSIALADKKGPGSCEHSFISERPDCSFDFSLQYHVLLKELFIAAKANNPSLVSPIIDSLNELVTLKKNCNPGLSCSEMGFNGSKNLNHGWSERRQVQVREEIAEDGSSHCKIHAEIYYCKPGEDCSGDGFRYDNSKQVRGYISPATGKLI